MLTSAQKITGVGCTKSEYCYPPNSDFFQLPQKGKKSGDAKDIDLTRDIK